MSFQILDIKPVLEIESSGVPQQFEVAIEINGKRRSFVAELNPPESGIQVMTGYPDDPEMYEGTGRAKPLEQIHRILVRLQRGESIRFPLNKENTA